MEEGVTYYEHTQRLTAQMWSRVHLWLGGSATAAASVSALLQSGAVSDESAWALVLASLAAALAGANTFLSPNDRAQHHRLGERDTNALRGRLRRFRTIELDTAIPSVEAAVTKLEKLAAERDRVVGALQTCPRRKFKQARRDIKRGLFAYDADESARGAVE
ncbi:MAG: SLATT domain-containing protein [Actinomycetota bacterium]